MADTMTYTMDDVLINLHRGAWWNYTDWNDRTYANLRVSEGFDYTLPTEEELNSQVTQLQAEYDALAYQRTRAPLYAELKEQLDQLYHDMTAGKLDATGEWHKAIKAVKDATPKP